MNLERGTADCAVPRSFSFPVLNMNGGMRLSPYEVVTGPIADGEQGWGGRGGNRPEPLLDVSTYDDITP